MQLKTSFGFILGAICSYSTFTCAVPHCDIVGEATLWAQDACFWMHETDDSEHPAMTDCLKRAQGHIAVLGECDAKHLFKNAICAQASKWQLNDDCLNSETPLGPALNAGL